MATETHFELANFIWSICNLLRGPYRRNEYRKVILPLTVLRRFDCILAPTKDVVLKEHAMIKARPENIIRHKLSQITGHPFYNLSKLDLQRLLDDPNQLAPNLNSYINGFSPNVRAIMERFDFGAQIARMAEKDLLYLVIRRFASIDLSPGRVDNIQMGYVFEELIRIGAEQSNEEAGEHFTPREVIRLMVNLLLSPENDLARSHVVKTIYDPACGTGGMLSVSEKYIHDLNADAQPKLFGQDWNDEAWAVCKSDMLIKGEDADNIIPGDTFTKDGFDRDTDGNKWTFDYMLANPPFGVEWKQQQRYIEQERDTLGFGGRFGAGTPRVNDGALLFLQHMLSKMRAPQEGGSRVAIVFNGSPLFTGDAGGGESEIRRWIIENDWLEAIVALPEQLFYNTGISTYLWILTNRKQKSRKGKIQLIDARAFWVPMEKSLGNKRRRIGDPSEERTKKDPNHIGEITKVFGDFRDGDVRTFPEEDPVTHQTVQRKRIVSKIFDNEDFGYHKIVVERPLRLNFQASAERIARLDSESAFKNLVSSAKKDPALRLKEIEAGHQRQDQIRALLDSFAKTSKEKLYKDRKEFLTALRDVDRAENVRLAAAELKAVLSALGERDETAELCRDREGHTEPDADLRDTETVPLKESIEAYFKREVLPHVSDAWIDTTKTKVGYEIPLNRYFYVYRPPRELDVIESDIKNLEAAILEMLKEISLKRVGYSNTGPSGIDWLGTLPGHWEVKRLKFVFPKLRSGVSVNSEASPTADGAPGILKTSCVYGNIFRSEENKRVLDTEFERLACPVTGNSLIISRMNTPELVGSCGYVATDYSYLFLPDRLWIARFSHCTDITAKFAWYLVTSNVVVSLTAALATGTSDSMKNLTQEAFLGISVGIPPKPEQLSITSYLDNETSRIDRLVAKNKELTERLEEKRAALISRAVTRGLPPSEAVAAGLAPNPTLRSSGVEWLGDVPARWEIKQLKWAILFQRGHDLPSDEREDGPVPLVTSAGVSAFVSRAVARAPGIVTGRYGTIGEFHLLETDYWPLNTTLYSIDLRGNDPGFLRYMLMHLAPLFILNAVKSAVPGVDRNDIHSTTAAVPPPQEQRMIAAFLDSQVAKVNALAAKVEETIERLQEFRASLITAAVTGKIDVRKAVA